MLPACEYVDTKRLDCGNTFYSSSPDAQNLTKPSRLYLGGKKPMESNSIPRRLTLIEKKHTKFHFRLAVDKEYE